MRHLRWLVVLMCVGCGDEAGDSLITKKSELDRDKDGRPDMWVEKVSRNGMEILTIRRTLKDGVTNTARFYRVGGETVMMEADEDNDGFLEHLFLYHPAKDDMEVFIRQTDGSVRPVNDRALAAHKEIAATFKEFFGAEFGTATNVADITARTQEAQRRIQAADRELRARRGNE